MVIPLQLCRTIRPLKFHSQEIGRFKVAFLPKAILLGTFHCILKSQSSSLIPVICIVGCLLCLEGNSDGQKLHQRKNIPRKEVRISTLYIKQKDSSWGTGCFFWGGAWVGDTPTNVTSIVKINTIHSLVNRLWKQKQAFRMWPCGRRHFKLLVAFSRTIISWVIGQKHKQLSGENKGYFYIFRGAFIGEFTVYCHEPIDQ